MHHISVIGSRVAAGLLTVARDDSRHMRSMTISVVGISSGNEAFVVYHSRQTSGRIVQVRVVANAAVNNCHGEAGTIPTVTLRQVGTYSFLEIIRRTLNEAIGGNVGDVGIESQSLKAGCRKVEPASPDNAQMPAVK